MDRGSDNKDIMNVTTKAFSFWGWFTKDKTAWYNVKWDDNLHRCCSGDEANVGC